MIERLAGKLADAFIGSGAVKADDRDVYVYGLDVLISTAANILCMLALGILLGRALEAALFLLFFTVLRSVAGGYHADTHFRCFLILLGTFGASMALVIALPQAACLWAAVIIAALSVAAVIALAPAPHPNRPVSAREIKKFRKLSLCIVFAEAAVLPVYLLLNAPGVALAGSLGMLSSAGSLCAAMALGRKNKGKTTVFDK